LATIKHFKSFSTKCYIKNNDVILGKFDAKAYDEITLGYSNKIKCYRCYNKRLCKIVGSIDVRADEDLPLKNVHLRYIFPPDQNNEEDKSK